MTKLTREEESKLNNTCGNLRITNLGTHVYDLEDFVNQMQLDTDSDTVSEAINELYHMIVNKDCDTITIPPPGFFTIFGDDQSGKLKVYYNDEDNPPLFKHVEEPGELEGTLYLYIADPEGENHYEMEIGHYIAVRHLDNYYTKAEIDAGYAIKNHAVNAGTYGKGTSGVFGHLKVANNLTTTSTDAIALAAAQGKVLKELIDSHSHGSITSDGKLGTDANIPLITGTGGAIQAGAFGTGQNNFARGNHSHGNISNDGKVGTTANVPLITGTGGAIQAGAFGTGQNNFARGNHGHSDLASIAYVDQQIASIDSEIEVDFASKADKIHSHNYLEITAAMSDNDDLNNYTSPGVWTCQNTTNLANKPFTQNVAIIVQNIKYNASVIVQFVYPVNSSTNVYPIYKRIYNTLNGWGNWINIVHSTELDSLNGSNLKLNGSSSSPSIEDSIGNKSDNGHTHTKGDITNFAHTHTKGDITNFAHTHTKGDITVEVIPEDSDLDDYITVGYYRCSSGNSETLGNKPFTGNSACIVENKLYATGNIVQFLYTVKQSKNYNDVYYRVYTGSAFRGWRKLATTDELFNYIEASSTNTKDLDDFKTGGFYYSNSDNESPYINNQPLTSNRKAFFLLVETWGESSDLYVKQTLTYHNNNLTYTRTCSKGTWSAWDNLNGKGTSSNFGHVKLSDSYTSSSGTASASVGASSKAVYDAYTTLKSDIVRMGWYLGDNINSGRMSNPLITIPKNQYLYIGCTDGRNNPLSGNLIVNYGGLVIGLTLSNGVGKIQASVTGEFLVTAWYYTNGEFKGSIFGKVTVT